MRLDEEALTFINLITPLKGVDAKMIEREMTKKVRITDGAFIHVDQCILVALPLDKGD